MAVPRMLVPAGPAVGHDEPAESGRQLVRIWRSLADMQRARGYAGIGAAVAYEYCARSLELWLRSRPELLEAPGLSAALTTPEPTPALAPGKE